ncbi:MAG: hypothetical protein MPW16_20330 [Candidatus Manganitrophus sp.]|nr:MAG: hypothetical protein MPW16_20330 [Candidatus Manganitrophus sp.]
MSKQVEKLEADALKLNPKDRARLAEKLLQSLETPSDEGPDLVRKFMENEK